MKLENKTGKAISFSVPSEPDKYGRRGSRWYTVKDGGSVDVLDENAWRGEAHGLVRKDIEEKVYKEVNEEKVNEEMKKDDFSVLSGISEELEGVVALKYGSLAEMKAKATFEELEAISGIGKKRAKSIMKQLANL